MSDYDNYDEYLAFDPNMPRCDIEELKAELEKKKEEYNDLFTKSVKLANDAITLAKTLLEKKPELEGWLKQNFKEYLDV